MPRHRRRDREVRAHDQQRANPATLAVFRPERIQQFEGGLAFARQRCLRDTPRVGHSLSMRVVFYQPVPWQLIRLLSVLSPALTVTLPGQTRVTSARNADLSER